jgi:hypothetical protein
MDNPERYTEQGPEFYVEPVSRAEMVAKATLVLDRKTGEAYDPKIKFDELMGRSDIEAVLKRLAAR